MDLILPNTPPLPSISRAIPIPLPIIEDPDPFKARCEHKVLVLKNTEKYAFLTRLNKIYTCVDCGSPFTMQPSGIRMLPLNIFSSN